MANIMENFKAEHSVREDRDAEEVYLMTEFDLSDLSDEDVLEYARRSMLIAHQAKCRAWLKSDRSKAFDMKVCKVPKPGTRTASDPNKIATKSLRAALKRMSPEQRAAFLAALVD